MIVHAFEETLDKGLQKEGEIVPMSQSSPVSVRPRRRAECTHSFPPGAAHHSTQSRPLSLDTPRAKRPESSSLSISVVPT